MKKHIGTLCVIVLWLSLSLWAWFRPTDTVSLWERRQLAQFPSLTTESILNGNFMEDFSACAVDQFPLRDEFRRLKSLTASCVFLHRDNNGIYIADGSAAKMEYPLNRSSVDNAIERFNDLYDLYLNESETILFAMVPDKGYYLGSDHLTMDYEALSRTLQEGLPWAEYVDLADCLTADSYYRTDTHWRQEALFPVAEKLAQSLNISAPNPEDYTAQTVEKEFYGVYYGQAALPMEPDVLHYLTWPGMEDCTVYSHDTGKTTQIYDLSKLDSHDLYEIFLSGGMAVQTITTPHAENDRELIVFRDSFASSLIPLLVGEYSTVTLVDTRYVSPTAVGDYVNFQGQDILMLYSTLILNSSQSLRK